MSEPVILFVSALQEEMDPLWFDPCFAWQEPEELGDSIWFRKGSFAGYTTIAAAACEMGLVASSILATKLILRWHPAIVIALGICAGPEQRKLTDVVISSSAFLYRFGRIVSKELTLTKPPLEIEEKTLLLARSLETSWPETAERKFGHREKPPAAVIGAYASADFLMKDSPTMRGLADVHNEFAALDMESYALLRAAKLLAVPYGAIVLKAVSDHGDEAKTDEGRAAVKAASKEAAVQLAELFSKAVPAPLLERARPELPNIVPPRSGAPRLLVICPHRAVFDAIHSRLASHHPVATGNEHAPEAFSDDRAEIVVARLPRGQFGHVDAAIWSSAFIKLARPHLVLLVGTCGGILDKDRLELGTLVFANRVFHFQFGKFEKGESIPEVRSVDVHDAVRGYLFARSGEELGGFIKDFYEKFAPASAEGKPKSQPGWRIDPLASSDLYLRDESESRAALRQDRKVIGVEMEGYAVMRSASHASVPLGALVIRSFSDYANIGDEGNPRYSDFARLLSAETTVHLLDGGLVEFVGRHVRASLLA
jgi:nucleoside phosphorylase